MLYSLLYSSLFISSLSLFFFVSIFGSVLNGQADGLLPMAKPQEVGLDPKKLEVVNEKMENLIEENRLTGGTVVIARNGKVAHFETYGLRNVKAVRKSAYWTLSFIAVIYLTAPALGMFARTNFIEEINQKKYQEAPEWFKNWENQGMIESTGNRCNNGKWITGHYSPLVHLLEVFMDRTHRATGGGVESGIRVF